MMEMVGGGEGVPREPRWRKCLHSTFGYTTRSREIVPVGFSYFDCLVREQPAEYFYSFSFVYEGFVVYAWLQRVHVCLCAFPCCAQQVANILSTCFKRFSLYTHM